MLLNTSRQHISKGQTLQNSTKLSILVSDNIRAAHVKMADAIKYSFFFFLKRRLYPNKLLRMTSVLLCYS